jgi:signal transduction histidine kinase
MSWLSLPIRRDADVVAVRSRVRALAGALPLPEPARARLVAAASELARWCAGSTHATVSFGWDELLRSPWVEFTARTALPHEVGDLVARLASSDVAIERRREEEEHCVLLCITPRAGRQVQPEPLRALLLRGDDATAIELLREQNREMARLLSELRAREEELASALERARQAANEAAENSLRLSELARRKDEVLAIVSHDIRSPLAAVKGALSMLQGSLDHLDEDQTRLLGIANRAGDAIVELVSNVLTSALIDAGESVYEPVPVDLARITSEVVGTLEIPATQKALKLNADIDTPATVLGDATWLRQVVSNLVMNAIKFTEKGGLVNVRVRVLASHVRLEVQDSGVGIPAEKRGQVFEKLRKLRAGGTAGERGSGLGLFITKKLVDRMGGAIEFESDEGQGTVFRVQLPASEEPALESAEGGTTASQDQN